MTIVLDDAILAAWFSAVVWLLLMGLAFLIHIARHEHHANVESLHGTKLKKLIVQITTIGDDIVNETVQRLLEQLADWGPDLYEVWVVNEPSDPRRYPLANKVLTVPATFVTTTGTKFKGRAHEYARLFRVTTGLKNYKVLHIDDDSVVSKQFLRDCFVKEFDLLQGPVTIGDRRNLMSYLDGSARTMSCLSLCSFFQELSHQLWTHGEGFCIDEKVDRAVSWDQPGWYAEDLVYGALATRKMGFRMRSTYATVQTNSPLGISQLIKQRRRWFWAFAQSSYLLPVSARFELWSLLIIGMVITPLAVGGMALAVFGIFKLPAALAFASQVLFGAWLGAWGFAGYYAQRSARGILAGILAAMIAPVFGFVVQLIGIAMGPVTEFEVMKRAAPEVTLTPVAAGASKGDRQ